MVRSIDPRCEQIRGTHWLNKVAGLIGTRVAETILASGLTSCINRPDIWTQAIRSNLTTLLCHGGRPHMGPRPRAQLRTRRERQLHLRLQEMCNARPEWSASSNQMQPRIHPHDLTGHVARGRRRKEADELRDVFRV